MHYIQKSQGQNYEKQRITNSLMLYFTVPLKQRAELQQVHIS